MNLADAIRQAAMGSGQAFSPAPEQGNQPVQPATPVTPVHNYDDEYEVEEMADRHEEAPHFEVQHNGMATDAVTSEPVRMPDPFSPSVATGSIVRLELFLSPEQLSGLFRAVVANQHSMMTLREAASYLRVHSGVLETMAQEGQIPAFQIDGRWRFPKQGVDEWLTLQSFRQESA